VRLSKRGEYLLTQVSQSLVPADGKAGEGAAAPSSVVSRGGFVKELWSMAVSGVRGADCAGS
jgi:hypothetical protein